MATRHAPSGEIKLAGNQCPPNLGMPLDKPVRSHRPPCIVMVVFTTMTAVQYFGAFRLPDQNAAAQRAAVLARALSRAGASVTIHGYGAACDGLDGPTELRTTGTETRLLVRPPPASLHHRCRALLTAEYELSQLAISPDTSAVICYNYPFIALLRLHQACSSAGIRLVYDTTEWYDARSRRFPFNVVVEADSQLRMRVANRAGTHLICGSRALFRLYERSGVTLSFFPSCVDLEDRKWGVSRAPSETERIRFCYTGSPGARFEKERLDWIVDETFALASRGIPCRLSVVGLNAKEYCQASGGSQAARDLSGCVDFYGRCSHTETLRILADSKWSIIARPDNRINRYGFPTKLGESLACGVPVITTPNPECVAVVRHRETGLVANSCSQESLGHAMSLAAAMDNLEYLPYRARAREDRSLDWRNYSHDLIATVLG